MATTISFTVLYKNVPKFSGKYTDDTVFTFETSAMDAEDAIRIFKMSRMYHVTTNSGRRVSKFRRFKVVRVYHGDGIKRCTCSYCKVNPSMSPAIRVIPSKMPRGMNRNYFGKSK
jgi:hypothetical protein